MSKFVVGCAITAGPGREDNLLRTLDLVYSTAVYSISVVLDGWGESGMHMAEALGNEGVVVTPIGKHVPGNEQPRNIAERMLDDKCDQVWFLDSDLIWDPASDPLTAFHDAYFAVDGGLDRILIGPYDWLAPGITTSGGQLEMADGRWPMFMESDPDDVFVRSLGHSLGCFGGNLVWPRRAFRAIGGFHRELNHGRCEDGELGLRACEAGIPMSVVRGANAYHVWHPRNMDWILNANSRDVPLLDEWHPWVHSQGVHPVEEDGCRFNFTCPECYEDMNTWWLWEHLWEHHA